VSYNSFPQTFYGPLPPQLYHQIITANNILRFLHQMFNVSALLLDDTLKPATPLTNGKINKTLTFHKVV